MKNASLSLILAIMGAAAPMLPQVLCAAEPAAAVSTLPAEMVQAFEAYIALPDTLEPALLAAQDKASADAAAPQLRQALEKLYDTRTQMQAVKTLTPEQSQEVQQRYALPMRRQWGRVYAQVFRLQKAQCYGSAAFAENFRLMCMMLGK